ncbi:MAG: putative response regulator, CheY [Ramlibacter sp.]|jgi:DNA-binding NarL/FixJ family response regulator|nr:putative response regulator, CheY [Ramlibacter sp.]
MAWRVFLVEDLRNMHTLLADLFASIGGLDIVAISRTEAEARLWLDEHPGGWDLAVIDLVLDQGSGMGVVSQARRQPCSGKVLVFSSYASPGIRAHCLSLGADAVFDKGEPGEFIEWLSREVRGPPVCA